MDFDNTTNVQPSLIYNYPVNGASGIYPQPIQFTTGTISYNLTNESLEQIRAIVREAMGLVRASQDGEQARKLELIEALADKEHASWTRWMDHLFSICEKHEDGSVTIPRALVMRWQRQIETPYEQLSEQEKQSDRREVAYILPIIDAYAASPDER